MEWLSEVILDIRAIVCRFDAASACNGVFDVSIEVNAGMNFGMLINSVGLDIKVDDTSRCESAGKGDCEASDVYGLDRSTRVLSLERLVILDKDKSVVIALEDRSRIWREEQGNGGGGGRRLLPASESD